MVPDLRMTMKVGAYSMSDEIRTHLEATGTGYLTGSSTQKILKGPQGKKNLIIS